MLIFVDLCRMSELACSFPHFFGSHQPRLQPTKKHVSNCYSLVSHMVWSGPLLLDLPSPSPEDVDSFECLSSRAHFCRFVSNVSARVLISDADANSFECLSSRAHFCRFVSNVSARVLISGAGNWLAICWVAQIPSQAQWILILTRSKLRFWSTGVQDLLNIFISRVSESIRLNSCHRFVTTVQPIFIS